MKEIDRRNHIKQSILSLIFLTLAFNTVKGQDDSLGLTGNVIPESWFQLGVGVKKAHLFFGGGLFFRVAERVAIGIRSGNAAEIRDPFTNPWESFWDITPSIAYTPIVASWGMISGITGIGIVGGVRRGQFLKREGFVVEQYEEIRFRQFCVAFELSGAVFVPGTRALALVASVYTNVNSERPFTGYYIGIQFRHSR